jgi:hypothetical protein
MISHFDKTQTRDALIAFKSFDRDKAEAMPQEDLIMLVCEVYSKALRLRQDEKTHQLREEEKEESLPKNVPR